MSPNNFLSTSSPRRNIKLDFESSFRPIIFFGRFLGVNIGSIKTTMNHWLSHFYAFFCLCINAGITIIPNFVLLNDEYSLDLNVYSMFTSLYIFSQRIICFISFFGSHLILLFFVRPRFAAVLQSFRRVENQLNDERLFLKLHNFSVVCIVIPHLLNLMDEIVWLVNDIYIGSTIHAIMWNLVFGFPQLYVNLSLILFAVSCYAAASSLNSIEQEIIRFHRIEMMTPHLASHCLQKWKRGHALICCTIDAIDDCFGPTLFLSVTFILLQLITGVFSQFMDCFCFGFEYVTYLNICTFLYNLFLLWLVCFPINTLRFKAENVLNSLLQLRLPQEPSVNEMANGLAIQMYQSSPQFSALGWFDIDLSIVLTLADLTLNYYFVLVSDFWDYVVVNK